MKYFLLSKFKRRTHFQPGDTFNRGCKLCECDYNNGLYEQCLPFCNLTQSHCDSIGKVLETDADGCCRYILFNLKIKFSFCLITLIYILPCYQFVYRNLNNFFLFCTVVLINLQLLLQKPNRLQLGQLSSQLFQTSSRVSSIFIIFLIININ